MYKIARDAQGARLAYLKITGGRLRVRDGVCHGGPESAEEKVNQIRFYSGAKYRAAEEAAAGCVCAETVWAYPPGIPLLLPGERIGADFAGYLVESAACGVTVYSSLGQLPQNIGVLIDKTP